jgi:hypothetical protein
VRLHEEFSRPRFAQISGADSELLANAADPSCFVVPVMVESGLRLVDD